MFNIKIYTGEYPGFDCRDNLVIHVHKNDDSMRVPLHSAFELIKTLQKQGMLPLKRSCSWYTHKTGNPAMKGSISFWMKEEQDWFDMLRAILDGAQWEDADEYAQFIGHLVSHYNEV